MGHTDVTELLKIRQATVIAATICTVVKIRILECRSTIVPAIGAKRAVPACAKKTSAADASLPVTSRTARARTRTRQLSAKLLNSHAVRSRAKAFPPSRTDRCVGMTLATKRVALRHRLPRRWRSTATQDETRIHWRSLADRMEARPRYAVDYQP